MQIKNNVIAITGAAQGLGKTIASRLARLGAQLALLDVDEEKLESVKAELSTMTKACEYFVCDVTSEQQVIDSFQRVFTHFGQIDGLVNNAGIIRDQFLTKVNRQGEIESHSLSNWQSVIDVNLTGVFLCAREASKHMLHRKDDAAIINISSISRAGNIGQSNYSASKSGVAALTVTWAKELSKNGIRVAAIAPGFIETEMTASIKPALIEHIKSSIPLNRMGQPSEIAHGVQFILENEYYNGRCLEIDGGLRI